MGSFKIEIMYIVDSKAKSIIDIPPDSHFPIQNLPYGVFRYDDNNYRVGVAIGDFVLDLAKASALGLIKDTEGVFNTASLNKFMTKGRGFWTNMRRQIFELLVDTNQTLADSNLKGQLLNKIDEVEFKLPVKISEFTDFYSSYYHAYNVGSLIRGPDNALMPNWKHLPVAYHGRASSVVLSGTALHRPHGQTKPADQDTPIFGPSKRVDFELEMGFFVGKENDLGYPITADDASEYIFGMVLVNDWSARDVQVWEYRPLGPFLAKNLGTSISPWVVTLDALHPFRTSGMKQEPEPFPYLKTKEDWTYDIQLEVSLQSSVMDKPVVITKSNAKNLYWTIAQQLAHHTITGCNMKIGDLCGSGTISGPGMNERGCLLELTELGKTPLQITPTETRTFLEDGDVVTMSGYAQGDGYRIGFGEVTTQLLPAINL